MKDTVEIEMLTDAYLEAYLKAMEKTKNADLAIQVAMGVCLTLNLAHQSNLRAQMKDNPMSVLAAALMAQIKTGEGIYEETDDDK